MSSTFIEHSPVADNDQSLYFIMDGEGNLTADPAHFEKLINNQKIPDMGIKIVRLDSDHDENGNSNDGDSNQELKLTVEEIYPEDLEVAPGDYTVMTSPIEVFPGPSNEHNHDIVDPFSEMDSEQLRRLEHALASEQAKQILGENVAAMLDMLTVDDSPAAFLQNTIKNDHCYTNLLPSSDPNGPSFFMNDSRVGKGKAKAGTPLKGPKILISGIVQNGNQVQKTVKEEHSIKQSTKQSSLLDYVEVSQSKVEEKIEDPSYEEDIDVEESENSAGDEEDDDEQDDEEEDNDNLSDEDYGVRTKRKRKHRKHKKRVIMKRPLIGKPFGRLIGGKSGRELRRSVIASEARRRNEKVTDSMSKAMQSINVEEKKIGVKGDLKSIKRIKSLKIKIKDQAEVESEKPVKEVPKPSEKPLSPSGKSQSAKYPKRENRKPPSHLVDSFGPALFSVPDIIRRVSTGEEVPQTPPEKKNFTVGAHSKTGDRNTSKSGSGSKPETSTEDRSKNKLKTSPTEQAKTKANTEISKESRENRTKSEASEKTMPRKEERVEYEDLIEKKSKPLVFEVDQDNSDENIEEVYLDPSQMDKSLLQGLSQSSNIISDNDNIDESIFMPKQILSPHKVVMVSPGNIEEKRFRKPVKNETIENIQNEVTSAVLVAAEEESRVQLLQSLHESSQGKIQDEGESELTIDESKEDRRRNSARRRRSDEVSDLDSDIDDALSEASWNSEDDPDRLWCICRKPHNNRFMICCDVCEEWFHGKCVGITKTIGKQMEQDGLEWSCPNCTKKKKAEEHDRESEKIKLLKEKMALNLKEKMALSIKEQQMKVKESQKLRNNSIGGKEKMIKSPKTVANLKQTKISDFSHTPNQWSEEEETVGRKCIMCKGAVRENSIYCSDDCIRKHSQQAISQLTTDSNKKSGSESSPTSQGENAKISQKHTKDDPRIVVMDSNSKKYLAGQSAPTASNLTSWLTENPSYHVVYKKTDNPGKILLTSRKVVKIHSKPGETQKMYVQNQKPTDTVKSTQLKLAVSPNSKQINIIQSALPVGKKYIQIVNTTGGAGKQTSYVVKPKQAEIIEALPLPVKTVTPKTASGKGKETSPKVSTSVTTPNKETTPSQKVADKVQKKKRSTETKMGTGKSEDVKDKDKEKKDTDQQIRESVKKTLAETLKARVLECKDLEIDEKHIDELAVKIEEKLFKHFENKVDTKYKSKYRSLVFNIKDPKNETLYKKIVDNSISPKELVKLSPEELASQELARWREKENQHQLEMIKKTELELMTKGNTYIMKSHKGERVIENDQSEKVAAVAAEIDPNTPVQELVSAINSVTSTTQDVVEKEEEENPTSETSLMKMKKKEKERRRSKDRKHDRRDRERRRSSSRSRSKSHRSKDKKRSRSRDREKERSRSRHRDKKEEKKKETKESEESGEKHESVIAKSEITTTVDKEKMVKKSVEEDEEDRVPSSTVIIKTPDINLEEPEPSQLWKGSIVMAEVAKFKGIATEMTGDCSGLHIDIPEKVDVVGRIPFNTVWDYIGRMKKMATKDIVVVKMKPMAEEEKPSYLMLYNYLCKRSRIGVIGKTSDAIKDFYLYPWPSHTSLPQVLQPLDESPFDFERENILLGIVVRNKHRSRHLGLENPKKTKKISVVEEESSHIAEIVSERSYTPPLPDKEQDELLKRVRQKRKVRVRMEYKTPVNEEEETGSKLDDDDSPYSPGDSDNDLPPLPKIAKTSMPSSISKLFSPHVTNSSDGNLKDPVEIQKKIEEINRAIEEQTQQIQSLTSAVPKLPGLPIPLLNTSQSTSNPLPPPPVEKVQLPLISESEECSSPRRSYTPPLNVEESIPFLPEVTSKISLPSNLQEILNSIQKKTGGEESETGAKETKLLDPRIANKITRPKPEFMEEVEEAVEKRLATQEIISPDEMKSENANPPERMKKDVEDIPILPYTNPPPPPYFHDGKKSDKKVKTDIKNMFESEGGVEDFNIPSASWEEKRGVKSKTFKIDILGTNTSEKKNIDMDHFDIESISNLDERPMPSGSGLTNPFDDDRMHSKLIDRYSVEKERRRSDDRDWKYERRYWDDGRRHKKDEYRRHDRRDRSSKFRFDHKSSRYSQKDREGSLKNMEERQKWRSLDPRDDVRHGKKRADSSSN